jgi:secondary thiamine-phosphate synthase enzyme
MNYVVKLTVGGQGLYDITHKVTEIVNSSGLDEGLVTVFIRHTSASLLIQENADPSAQRDLEVWLNRLVPENDDLYTHTVEGPDDMPAHIKSALTAASLSIPVSTGTMMLGTWQGIFLWEHRHHRGEREVVLNLLRSNF